MPTMTVPEVRLPKVDLGQIDLPRVDLPKVDLPKVDLSHIELPKVDLRDFDLPREIEDRLPGRRRRNPLPFALVGMAIIAAGIWLIAWSPMAPRIRAAVSDARVRLGMGQSTTDSTDDSERLDEYDTDSSAFASPEGYAGSSAGPAFEPDRSAMAEDRVASLGS